MARKPKQKAPYKDLDSDRRSWRDEPSIDFDAASLGDSELDDMSLTQLLTELFDDINQGKLLRHGLVKGAREHGIEFGLQSASARFPYMLTSVVNVLLSGKAEDLPEDKKMDEIVLTEYGFEKQRRDPGPIGSVASAVMKIPPERLPIKLTHNIQQIIGRNATEVNMDLREMAQRLDQRGYNDISERVRQYALRNQREGTTADETTELLGEVLQRLSEGSDRRVADYARQLQAMLQSDEPHKHNDIRKEVRRQRKKLERAEQKFGDDSTLDQVYKKGIGERVEGGIAGIMGSLPKPLVKKAPFIIAGAAALGLFFGGYSGLGTVIKNHLHDNDLHNRTSFTAPANRMPGKMNGFNNTGKIVADAGNFSALMDRGYMDANADLPFNYRGLGETLVIGIDTTLEELEEMLKHYDDPELVEGLDSIRTGGSDVMGSVSHWHISHYSTDTDCDSDGENCTTTREFEWRTDYWTVDLEQGWTGIRELKEGFYNVRLTESGLAIAELALLQFPEDQYANMDNKTMRAWNRAVPSIRDLPSKIAEFNGEWADVPGSHSETTYACDCRQSWWVEDMVDDVGGTAQRVAGLITVRDNLHAYDAALGTALERLSARKRASEVFAEHPGMGDSSIDIIRALGYPKGKGHLYQDEIDKWVKFWRWGLGITGIAVAGIGLYVYEKGHEGRRRSRYKRFNW